MKQNKEKNLHSKIKLFLKKWTFLLIGVVVLPIIFIITTESNRKSALKATKEALSVTRQSCYQYDNYSIGIKIQNLILLREKANSLSEYTEKEDITEGTKLLKYANDKKISGIIVLDNNLKLVAQSDKKAYETFSEILKRKNVADITENNRKSYMEQVTIKEAVYDCVVVSAKKIGGLILCYNDVTYDNNNNNEISLEKLIAGYRFKMDGVIVVTDENRVINSNVSRLQGIKSSHYPVKNINPDKWETGKLVRLKWKGNTWYGGKSYYKNYHLYAFFPKKQVFIMRTTIMFFSCFIYIMLCLVLLFVRYHSTKNSMRQIKEQLRTINAISSIYTTNMLIMLDSKKWEPIKISGKISQMLSDKKNADDMLDCYITNNIKQTYHQSYRDFVNLSTISGRLKGKNFIDFTFEDINGQWFYAIIVPQKWDENNNVVAVLLATRNINEDKCRELNYQNRLREAAAEAKRANEAKTVFLRRISHDIRTPINGIRGMVAISSHYKDQPEKQEECRQKILTASGFLLDLVNDVLDMNKLESGKVKLEHKAFNIKQIYDETSELIEIHGAEMGVTFEKADFEGKHNNLIGSPLHLRQVLQNIMSNAIKHNHESGSVNVSCREISSDDNSATFEFICSDTGRGMSREFQRHLFEPFAQEENEARTKYRGTGLGLPIAKELVEQMGGKITFVSEKNKGTTFRVFITLPISYENIPVRAEKTYKYSMWGKKILLVEDNELNMEITQFLLESEGFVVVKAWNGKEAVEHFEKSRPGTYCAILMDIMMPVMDGLKATRIIRNLSRQDAKDIPIIAVTANAFDEDREQSRNAGMNAHLSKPLNKDKLMEAILMFMSN